MASVELDRDRLLGLCTIEDKVSPLVSARMGAKISVKWIAEAVDTETLVSAKPAPLGLEG